MSKQYTFAISSLSAGSPFVTEDASLSYELETGSNARLVRIYWKASKSNPNPRKPIWVAAKAVRMTDTQCEAIGLQWASILHNRLDDIQDTLIKEWLESHPADVSGCIPESETGETAIIAWARKDAVGKRLSQESVGAWFDLALTEPLMTALIAKGIQDENKLATFVKAYRTKFAALAAPVPSLTETEFNELSKAIALAPESPMQASLSERIRTGQERFAKESELGNLL